MDYGIAFPSYIDAWRDAAAAEAAGFSHAWFFDSQLIYSDVYATMALAAEHTSRIKLGTLVAIPSNRIPAVTASAIATINYLAPGRVILGLGTGYTGRNTMGLPAVPAAEFREYTQQVRGLLQGDEVLIREGARERWIRLLHPDRGGFINIEDAIPIYLAASGPKALAATGELADGWVTGALTPQLAMGFEAIRAAAAAAGRATDKPYTVGLTSGCVLRDGESLHFATRGRARRPQRAAGSACDVGVALWPRGEPGYQGPRRRGGFQSVHRGVRRRARQQARSTLPGCAHGAYGLSQAGRGTIHRRDLDRQHADRHAGADHRAARAD